ncbi:MAG: hypothetical protein CG439_1877 [Methylococcaceae bacterium NSP1-2]|nr:MAG: hypothetical protein CG439_1877 [Methylococcaceae bacterium NSP1-2]
MELPEASIERLKNLKEKTEAVSYAEVTKNAYRLYERIIELSDSGYTFCLKDDTGNIKEIELFM